MSNEKPESIGVVVTTYNSPDWLHKVLVGYECQTDTDFKVLIADDGSDQSTAAVVEQFKKAGKLNIQHFWHEDKGFRKTIILNKVIAETDCDYLIFTDGDCIPRNDFIAVHRAEAGKGRFLSGGYVKLSMPVSERISDDDIQEQLIFSKNWLVRHGQPSSFKLSKLIRHKVWVAVLNSITPTKATWNGMNSSGWRQDLLSINGFDERMQYGGLDREMGERLLNKGIESKQIRYSAICLHLDHPRGYSKPEIWEFNNALRQKVKAENISWTDYGIVKSNDS
ncbi:glycosyltransferase family 2 protein [Reinekea marinisedimentorum]|uniref:Glycosyltransferase involved in cell wall biosynthesis n=1 Tax=Reinekea marinisedimentorum TaxID=230495 RepID=A0A4R3I1B1_9GAMM|nr:glycosyltransferase family 2 protein [Reinekea marinisedimentorum]TCS37639.1 glycosyltransferase involved in cell wall biosynthesis [Reinekea marinisedimentorum]